VGDGHRDGGGSDGCAGKVRSVDSVRYCDGGTQTTTMMTMMTTTDDSSSYCLKTMSAKSVWVMEKDNDDQPKNDEPSTESSRLSERERWEQSRKMQESALLPVTDDKSLRRYRTFVEESEKKSYALKERELDRIMKSKLERFQRDLIERYSRNDQLIEERIEVR